MSSTPGSVGRARSAGARRRRVCATVPAASRHRLVTLLVPYSLSEPKRIFSFIDDQGFSTDIYFSDVDDERFKLSLPKQF